jgi:hypothetical protein
MLAFSIAYPQLENLNTNQKTLSIEFKSKTGELTSGELIINENKNKVLNILSLIIIILGPIILLWKFLIESKDITTFYNKMHDSLKKEYKELLNIEEFKKSTEKSKINEIFVRIHDKGIIKKADLLNLKKEITPQNKRYRTFGK